MILDRVAGGLLRARWVILAVIAIVTAVAVWTTLRYFGSDFGFRAIFESSPDIPLLEEYTHSFGEDSDFLVVVARAPDAAGVVTPSRLATVREMADRIENMPAVDKVWALTKVDDIKGTPDGFALAPLLPEEIPSSPDGLVALRKELVGNRLMRDFLLDGDATTTAIIAEVVRSEASRDSAEYAAVEKDRDAMILQVHALVSEIATRGTGLELYLAGVPVVQEAYMHEAISDQVTFLPVVIAMLGLTLLVTFRNLHGLYIPLSAVVIGMIWAMAVMFGTGEKLNILNNIIPTLLLVYGSADAIHIIARYYEELPRHDHQKFPALRSTMRSMLVPCFYTSITTAVGFGSLYWAHIDIIRWLGVYAAVGILLAYVVCVTLTPAALALHAVPTRGVRRKLEIGLLGRFLVWHSGFVLRRRWWIIGASVVVTAVALVATMRLKVESRMLEELPPDHAVTVANRVVEERLSGVLSYAVLLDGPAGVFYEPAVLRKIDEIAAWGEADPQMSRSISLAAIVKEAHKSFNGEDDAYYAIPDKRSLIAKYVALLDPDTVDGVIVPHPTVPDADRTHLTWRAKDMPSTYWITLRGEIETKLAAAFPAGGPITARVTGSSALAKATLTFIVNDMFTSGVSALLIVTVFMGLLFRSPKIGLISMIPNVIPLFATLGYMALAGVSLRTSTAMIFAVALGIAVDDTIHVISRYSEEIRATKGDVEKAVYNALLGTGRACIFTTVILVMGFGVLTISDFIAIEQFGRLTGLTLFVALAADLYLTPALLLVFRPRFGATAEQPAASPGATPTPADEAPKAAA